MKVGYVRVSRQDQNPDLQRRELEAAGCEKIFEEKVSSRKERRPVLQEALDYVRGGDVLVVWRLDRLGRSLKELIELVGDLQERGVEFKSLRESLDTTTSGGKLIFHVFASIAEFERDIIRERTMAGLEAARARGRRGGRKRVMDEKKVALASAMLKDHSSSVTDVCEALGVSRATLYRYVRPDGTPMGRVAELAPRKGTAGPPSRA
jgi:DNA invertase Pin-like site-specific DNA recombinase